GIGRAKVEEITTDCTDDTDKRERGCAVPLLPGPWGESFGRVFQKSGDFFEKIFRIAASGLKSPPPIAPSRSARSRWLRGIFRRGRSIRWRRRRDRIVRGPPGVFAGGWRLFP